MWFVAQRCQPIAVGSLVPRLIAIQYIVEENAQLLMDRKRSRGREGKRKGEKPGVGDGKGESKG